MTKAKKILRAIKEGAFLLAFFLMVPVLCTLSWDEELLGGKGD